MTRSDTPSSREEIPPPDEPAAPRRRRLLAGISVAGGGLIALAASAPLVGFLFAPLVRRGQVWRDVGDVGDLAIGETRKVSLLDPGAEPWSGRAGRSAAWLRRTGQDEFEAFSLYCSHTGCPVRWDDGSELFLCPCHGGVFYRDGTVAAGPPPAPLERHPVRVRNRRVELRTIGVPTPTG